MVTLESLVRRSWTVLQQRFLTFFQVALLIYAPVLVLAVLSASWSLGSLDVITSLLQMILLPLVSASIVYGVFRQLRGEAATVGECLQVLEDVLRRPPSSARDELMASICAKIQRKIDWQGDPSEVDARLFLQAFYAAQRGALEKGMLFGQRRERKVR